MYQIFNISETTVSTTEATTTPSATSVISTTTGGPGSTTTVAPVETTTSAVTTKSSVMSTTSGTTTPPSVTTGPTTAQPTTGGSTTMQGETTTVCEIDMVDENNIEKIYTEENLVDASTEDGLQPTTGSTTIRLTFTPKSNVEVEGVDYVKLDVEDAESVTIEYMDGDVPKSETIVSISFIWKFRIILMREMFPLIF